MDYNRMKKSSHGRSKEYLAIVLEDRESRAYQPYHSKRKSEEDPPVRKPPPQQHYLYTNNSRISANSYQNRQKMRPPFVNGKQSTHRFATQQAPKINKPIITIDNIIILKQRLRNIHEDYKILIEQEKAKNTQRTQSILELLDQMQSFHQQKIQNLRRMIESTDEEKKEVGLVDQKMNQIKTNIQQLINQSGTLKQKNDTLIKKIEGKKKINDGREVQLQELKQQVLQIRNEYQQLQIKNIKNNRINKEIIQIFKTATSIQQDQ